MGQMGPLTMGLLAWLSVLWPEKRRIYLASPSERIGRATNAGLP